MHTCFQVTPYASYIELCEAAQHARARTERKEINAVFDRR